MWLLLAYVISYYNRYTMAVRTKSKLDPKKKYLQVALNSTLEDAKKVIEALPISDRIIVEAGTPLIKRYGEHGIRQIRYWHESHLAGINTQINLPQIHTPIGNFFNALLQQNLKNTLEAREKTQTTMRTNKTLFPYIVADLKTMDRGETEVELAARAGASAVVALGEAPTETLNRFIASCKTYDLDAMVDMMNVEYPLSVLRALKEPPSVVILHRGVDEERDNREKQIPLHEIRRIKGNYNIMISIAGGDTLREVQRSIFNDADIVVVWKPVYQQTKETIDLVNGFLKVIK